MNISDKTITVERVGNSFCTPSVFRYHDDLMFENSGKSDVKSVDFIEGLLMNGKIALSDMFILECMQFFGHATLSMVVFRLKYMKSVYPERPIVTSAKNLATRIHTLGKNGVLWRRFYHLPSEQVIGTEYIHIYSGNYRGYELFSRRIEKLYHYDAKVITYSDTAVLRCLHIGEVACILINRLSNIGEILDWRQNAFSIKMDKGRYMPGGYIKCAYSGMNYNFIIEAIHFNVNPKYETAEERVSKIAEKMINLKNVKEHYATQGEQTVFVFCVEDFEGVSKLVRQLEVYPDTFADNTYITSERVLKMNGEDFGLSMIKTKIIDGSLKIDVCDRSKEWFF